jgi:hypothetical protein
MLPVEFEDKNFGKEILEAGFYIVFFDALLIMLFFIIKENDKLPKLIIKAVLSFLITIPFYFILVVICIAASPPNVTKEQTIFIYKADETTKIVERFTSSGFFGGDETSSGIVKTEKINNYFIWVSEIDTTKLNKSEWIRNNDANK